jgi:hypothetical protein
MIKRELYIKRIRPFFNKNIVKILVGMRRSGKSVMLQLIKNELMETGTKEEQFIYINFESEKNSQLKHPDALYKSVSDRIEKITGKAYIMLDEIQEVEEWQKVINSFMVDFDADIYITGSNAKLLSGEFATYLAGRYVEIVIYPFSYSEVLDLYKADKNDFDENKVFLEYLQFVGMPFLYGIGYEPEASILYLTDIYNSVILKDVVQRNHIRDVELLDRIIKFIISNVGSTFSSKSISDYLKSEQRTVAPETVYNYISACENAYLFHRAAKQNLMGKALLRTQDKVFLSDHGIREAIYGNNRRDVEKTLENIVYMELLRRGYKVTVGSINGKEIDFVAERRNEKLYIQVTYVMGNEDTINREFEPLLAIRDNYPKFVISMLDEIDMSRDGIRHVNIREFLKSN